MTSVATEHCEQVGEEVGEEVVVWCRILVITYHYDHVKLGRCSFQQYQVTMRTLEDLQKWNDCSVRLKIKFDVL